MFGISAYTSGDSDKPEKEAAQLPGPMSLH
jgi:hypothetical protein